MATSDRSTCHMSFGAVYGYGFNPNFEFFGGVHFHIYGNLAEGNYSKVSGFGKSRYFAFCMRVDKSMLPEQTTFSYHGIHFIEM